MSTTASAPPQAPAAMAAIDPHSVLEQLDPLLGQTGCIRSSKEVGKIVSLMKTAQLLVVKIVLLSIVKATRAPSTLDRFMDSGWPVLNVWLAEAKKNQDVAILVEVLQVLQKLPVSVAALKQGNMGKLIKQLSKQEHPEVKNLASDLLSKWMAIFKDGQAATKSHPAGSTSDTPEKEKEKDKTAASSTAATKSQDSAPSTPTKIDKDKDKKDKPSKKKDKSSKGAANLPPVESKPPPGPLVALGRRDKPMKRPRDFPLKGQPPVEKKTKPLSYSEEKMKGKGPVESEGFMNALSSQAAKMKEKKRKLSKPKALSLVSKTGSGGVAAGEGDSPTPTSAEPQEPMDTSSPTSDQKGEEGSKTKKKTVSWAEDSNLVMVHYFEMDESERAINREHGSFIDAAQREKMREREARESGLMFIRDRLIEMISWQRPQRNETLLELVNHGVNSEQRKIQAEREEKVLAQLFLSKSSLHPSPAEPDAEPDTGKSEPKHIPLMEPTVDGQQQSSPAFSSPPHQVGGVPPPHMTTAAAGSPLQSPVATIHQAQSLINYFNEGKDHMPPDSRPHPPGPPDQNSFHPPPGPHPPPHFPGNGPGMMPPVGGTGDFYNNFNQQGFPPGIHNPDWNGPMTSGYYSDYGGGAPPIRRGMRGGYRGRGRGFSHGYGKGPHAEAFSKICKHFVTHGCRLGTKCRFLHCTPSQLAEKLSTQQDPAQPQSSPQDTSSSTNANSSNNKPDVMATDSAADDNRS